eukprot:746888-Hanusia_phi.AAC.6
MEGVGARRAKRGGSVVDLESRALPPGLAPILSVQVCLYRERGCDWNRLAPILPRLVARHQSDPVVHGDAGPGTLCLVSRGAARRAHVELDEGVELAIAVVDFLLQAVDLLGCVVTHELVGEMEHLQDTGHVSEGTSSRASHQSLHLGLILFKPRLPRANLPRTFVRRHLRWRRAANLFDVQRELLEDEEDRADAGILLIVHERGRHLSLDVLLELLADDLLKVVRIHFLVLVTVLEVIGHFLEVLEREVNLLLTVERPHAAVDLLVGQAVVVILVKEGEELCDPLAQILARVVVDQRG